MIPDRLYFTDHARNDKIPELAQMPGIPSVSVDWAFGRVMNQDGDLYRKEDNPRYELFCPDHGDIAIQYQIEIRGMEKVATVVTVMLVTDPYGRYRRNGQWNRVDT